MLLALLPGRGHIVSRPKETQLSTTIPLRPGLLANQRITVVIQPTNLPQALLMYSELTGRTPLPRIDGFIGRLNDGLGGRLARWHLVKLRPIPDSGLRYHADGQLSAADLKEKIEAIFYSHRLVPVSVGNRSFRLTTITNANRAGVATKITETKASGEKK